jgi:hypothetical protein
MTTAKATLEASTFQKRPAYRYIRATDKLPRIDELGEDPIARVKLFDPTGSWTWYIAGYDPETRQTYGLVDGFEREIGMFSMAELVELRGRFGLPIERDLYYEPKRLSELQKRA